MKKYHYLLSIVLGMFLLGCSTQDNKLTNFERHQIEVEVQQVSKNFVNSYNTGDSQIFDPLWSMDAFYQNPVTGEEFDGRDMISFIYKKKFDAGIQGKIEILFSEIEIINSEKVIEKGVMEITKLDQSKAKTGFLIDYSKKNNRWIISNLKEISIDSIKK